MSSLNRNVVNMSHRNARKLIRKTVHVSSHEDYLYREPIGIRQMIGLTEWNKILKSETIPK